MGRILLENLRQYPDAKHFVITHSHGDKWAMYDGQEFATLIRPWAWR